MPQFFCTWCGTNLPDGARFCPNCGYALAYGNYYAPPAPPKRSNRKILAVIVIVVIVVGLGLTAVLSGLSFLQSSYSSYPVYYSGGFGRYLQNPGSPAPTGLGAFGLSDNSGTIHSYVINTSIVYGNAEIQALTAYNSSIRHDFQNATTLQLNAMLMVNTTSGTQAYWLQDVVTFDTRLQTASVPEDSIFNMTTRNATIKAFGAGLNYVINGTSTYIYAPQSSSYSLPLNLTMGISVALQNDVSVNFYNSPFGELYSANPSCKVCLGYRFDTASLPIRDAKSAAIVVTPYQVAAGYLPYDAELTWGGACCGFSTTFSNMSSTLSLGYVNASGQPSLFPSYYTFGGDTGEFANNLAVTLSSNGVAQVSVGRQDNAPLSPTA